MPLMQYETGRQDWAISIQHILAQKMVLVLLACAKVLVLRHVSSINLKIHLFPVTNETDIQR